MIAGILLFLTFSIVMGVFVSQPNPLWSYFVVGILVFFMTFMIAFGGVAIMKSDLDYLFVLPLKRRELAISFYITQFFATGISFVFMFGYSMPYLAGSLTELAVIGGDIILISLMITALSILAYSLSVPSKILLLTVMVLWTASPVLGFHYSFTSVFFGEPIIGTILTVAVNIPINYFALRELGSIEIGFTKVSVRISGDIYKNQIAYSRHTARGSIFLYNLLQLNMTSRMNIGATTSQRSARIKLHYLLIPMSILAVVYAVLARVYDSGEPPNVAILIASIYLAMFIPIFFSQGVLSYERAWLAFTSVPAYLYWRRVIFSKYIQMVLMILPFFFASIYLHIIGVSMAINTLPLYIIAVPSIAVLVMYLSGLLTMDQVKEPGTLSAQFSLRQMVILLPIAVSFAVVIISLMFWQAGLIASAVLFGLMLLVVLRKKAWTRLVYRLTERGFV